MVVVEVLTEHHHSIVSRCAFYAYSARITRV